MTHEAPKPESSAKPVPKVAAAGIAGAAMTLIIFAAQMFGFPMPETVAAAVVTIVAFVAGYFKR